MEKRCPTAREVRKEWKNSTKTGKYTREDEAILEGAVPHIGIFGCECLGAHTVEAVRERETLAPQESTEHLKMEKSGSLGERSSGGTPHYKERVL